MTQEIFNASFGAMLDSQRATAMGTLLEYAADESNPTESRRAVLKLLDTLDEAGDRGVACLKDLNVTTLVNDGLTSHSIAKILGQHFG